MNLEGGCSLGTKILQGHAAFYRPDENLRRDGRLLMKAAGIIAEYNPFHEGHRYHIEETKRRTGADYVIAVMSGDYVQRGEPAIVDKYIRTEMALRAGADVVFELPCAYATASAEHFAGAGVKLLDCLGVCSWLSFGSEWANEKEMAKIADLLVEEPGEYREALREGIRQGLNYPAARAAAVCSLLTGDKKERTRLLMEEPNHILGLEYMKALRKLNSDMEVVVIERKGSGYHEEGLETSYASAAGIRNAVITYFQNNRCPADPHNASDNRDMECHTDLHGSRGSREKEWLTSPDRQTWPIPGLAKALGDQYDIFADHIERKEYLLWDDLMPFLRYGILYGKEMLSRYSGTDMELARRIGRLYKPDYSFRDLVEVLHVKNRADSALKRALLRIFLQIRQQPYLEDGVEAMIPYGRILGFRREASPLIRKIREKASIDIIQRPVLARRIYSRYSQAMDLFRCDLNGADIYEQILAEKCHRNPVAELVREQIIV